MLPSGPPWMRSATGYRLIALEIAGLHHVAEDVVVVRAREIELLVLPEAPTGQIRLIQMGELRRLSAVEPDRVEVRGIRKIALREVHLLCADAESLDIAVAGDRRSPAAARIDCPQGMLAQMIGGGEQSLAVARPGEAADRSIPILGERTLGAALQIEEDQMKPVGLVPRPVHGRVRERRAVRRERRLPVPGWVIRGDIARGAARRPPRGTRRNWWTRARPRVPRGSKTPPVVHRG